MKKLFSSLKKTGVDPKAVKTIYTASCTFLQLLLFFPKFIAVGLEWRVLKRPNSCIFSLFLADVVKSSGEIRCVNFPFLLTYGHRNSRDE